MSDGSRLIGYVRVSTSEQATKGVSLDMQERRALIVPRCRTRSERRRVLVGTGWWR
jgi:DNA invertase Pin-like site-specific DNA recombinase